MDQETPLTPDSIRKVFPPDEVDMFLPKEPPFPAQDQPGAGTTWVLWYGSVGQVALLLEQERWVSKQEITDACLLLLKHSEQFARYVQWLTPEQRMLFQDGVNTADAWLRQHGIEPRRTQQQPKR